LLTLSWFLIFSIHGFISDSSSGSLKRRRFPKEEELGSLKRRRFPKEEELGSLKRRRN